LADRFETPLPGVPAIDSPFFDRIFADPAIDPAVLRVARDLRELGYAVIDFPEPDFAAIAERIKANLRPRYDWESWQADPRAFDARIQDAWTFDADVKRIAVNGQVMALLEALYGRPAFPFQTLNFCVGSQQRVHSDSVHFSSFPAHFMCGVWVALEDVDLDNGPLVYHPGSNRWPIYTNEHLGLNGTVRPSGEIYKRYEDMWEAMVAARGAPVERFFAKAGQAIIWSANLLHGGDSHRDLARTRWSQVTHYFFEGCAYHTPLLSDPYTGSIFFREPVDIVTGIARENTVSGVATPREFITSTIPAAFKPPPPWRRVLRRLRGG
jgi:hypothetical protein